MSMGVMVTRGKPDQVRLRSPLENQDGGKLEVEGGLEVLDDFPDKALEQELCRSPHLVPRTGDVAPGLGAFNGNC